MLYQLPDLLSVAAVAAEGGGGTGEIIGLIVTHIIGFLIVFWILKRFAWGPLLGVMEERRRKIASEFERIEKLSQEADQRREEYETRIQKIEDEARERINKAVTEGRKVATEIQENARRDAEKIREKAKATCEIELAKAKQELRDEVVRLTIMSTEKLIHERLDDEKHRTLITEFVDQLGN